MAARQRHQTHRTPIALGSRLENPLFSVGTQRPRTRSWNRPSRQQTGEVLALLFCGVLPSVPSRLDRRRRTRHRPGDRSQRLASLSPADHLDLGRRSEAASTVCHVSALQVGVEVARTSQPLPGAGHTHFTNENLFSRSASRTARALSRSELEGRHQQWFSRTRRNARSTSTCVASPATAAAARERPRRRTAGSGVPSPARCCRRGGTARRRRVGPERR